LDDVDELRDSGGFAIPDVMPVGYLVAEAPA
jgi:hypothetical protein